MTTELPKLGQGLEFVGVYGYDPANNEVWRLCPPVIQPDERAAVIKASKGAPAKLTAIAVINARSYDSMPTFDISTTPMSAGWTTSVHNDTRFHDGRIRCVRACVVDLATNPVVYVRLSVEPWKTVSVYDQREGALIYKSGLPFEPNLEKANSNAKYLSCRVNAMAPLHDANVAFQLAAWDRDGNRLSSMGVSRSAVSSGARISEELIQSFNGPGGELGQIALQRRKVTEYAFTFAPHLKR